VIAPALVAVTKKPGRKKGTNQGLSFEERGKRTSALTSERLLIPGKTPNPNAHTPLATHQTFFLCRPHQKTTMGRVRGARAELRTLIVRRLRRRGSRNKVRNETLKHPTPLNTIPPTKRRMRRSKFSCAAGVSCASKARSGDCQLAKGVTISTK